jgi:hypothetical protein
MKRFMLLAIFALVASLVFAPAAMAQQEMVEETIMGPAGEATIEAEGPPPAVEPMVQQEEQKAAPMVVEETKMMEKTAPLPSSGGPAVSSVLLPVAALLLGSGVLAYAFLRRR